jgi:hypothetical protein
MVTSLKSSYPSESAIVMILNQKNMNQLNIVSKNGKIQIHHLVGAEHSALIS